jgi:hypothetical protein
MEEEQQAKELQPKQTQLIQDAFGWKSPLLLRVMSTKRTRPTST